MCGIAGIVSPHHNFVQQPRLQIMADTLKHRGPDGEAYWVNETKTVGFAHRRLCVLDFSQTAAQPFHYLHYTIVFNGEIYNYRELKNELRQKGYVFTTSCDTEVIPAAYNYWGTECLQHFDGMFAFALYDNKTQQLFIARDRLGEKPLYYYADYIQHGRFEQFLFASEMKALFAAGIAKHLNGTIMLNFLTLGYVQNPYKQTQTFYNDVLQLPAGHYLTVNPDAGRLQMKKWYKPLLKTISVDTESAIEKFISLLKDSVDKRLRSDVAIGTSLSGGLDSSSIIAVIDVLKQQKSLLAQWKNMAFTAGFPGFEKDETAYSKTIAEHFNIIQQVTSPSANDLADAWNTLTWHQEEPFQSSSVFIQFMVYKLARQHGITVLLDGQGADEILAGYTKYIHWFLQQLLRENKSLYQQEKKALQKHGLLNNWSWKNYVAAYFPEAAAKQLQKRATQTQNKSTDINPDFLQHYQNTDVLHKPVVKQLEDILYHDTFNMGLQELLRFADRNSMAHSVEVRLPFLQHELVEFCFSLPATFKIKDGFTKWLLRESMKNMLPAKINKRTDKIGFEPPQKQWMQTALMKEMIIEAKQKLVHEKVLQSNVIQQPVKPQHAHEAGNNDFRYLSAAALF